MQQKQPIAYFREALLPTNQAKSIYEKEIMMPVLVVQHWRHCLLGRNFKVFIDHNSLCHLLQQRLITIDQECCLVKLTRFQFEVIYKPGLENKVVDALS